MLQASKVIYPQNASWERHAKQIKEEAEIFLNRLQHSGGNGTGGGMEARVEKLESDVKALDSKFDAVMKKLDGMDARFDRIDQKFEKIEEKLEKRFEKLDDKIDSIKDDVKKVEVSVANLQGQASILKWLLTPVVAGVVAIFIKMFLP